MATDSVSFGCHGTTCRCPTYQSWLCAGWATGLMTLTSRSRQNDDRKRTRTSKTQRQTMKLPSIWINRKPTPPTTPRTTVLPFPEERRGRKRRNRFSADCKTKKPLTNGVHRAVYVYTTHFDTIVFGAFLVAIRIDVRILGSLMSIRTRTKKPIRIYPFLPGFFWRNFWRVVAWLNEQSIRFSRRIQEFWKKYLLPRLR